MRSDRKRRRRPTLAGSVLFYVILGLILLLALAGRPVADWVEETFDVTVEAILYTVAAPLKGTESTTVSTIVGLVLPSVPIVLLLLAVLLFLERRIASRLSIALVGTVGKRRTIHIGFEGMYRTLVLLAALAALFTTLRYADQYLGVSSFIKRRTHQTRIYEERYVDPNDVSIAANGPTKNLIYIYLESMENSYASQDVGGAQPDVNYIPNLTRLAQENISFSNTDLLGGWRRITGTTWTAGAMFATNSGVPFAFPIQHNSMNKRESFAAGITTMGDILAEKGYRQEFLCGSDANFGGRKQFYEAHGDYEIFDYYTAIERGYIAEDYKVWWGFEDQILYEIAKDEITRLAAEGEPFNFTFLTVDTHYTEGYTCALCEDTYPEPTANIVVCADKQVNDFIEWCREQDFFEDTLIVISGDHPRMDKFLVEGLPNWQRRVYNCFINAETDGDFAMTDRQFTAMDMMPTVLSAMGFEIEGGRLGLGVDLFSDQQTLLEEMGYQSFKNEITSYSKYYIDHFS